MNHVLVPDLYVFFFFLSINIGNAEVKNISVASVKTA